MPVPAGNKGWYIFSLALLVMIFVSGDLRASQEPAPNEVSKQEIFTQPGKIQNWLAKGVLRPEQIPNPHWQEDGCISCHVGKPRQGQATLRDASRLCGNCHAALSVHSYIHPAGLRLRPAMRKRLPQDFRGALVMGKVACTTCHESLMQCLTSRRQEQGKNPMFLRGGPYRDRTEPCYVCHDETEYTRLNPHEQITRGGQIREATCVLCHGKAKGLRDARNINETSFNEKQDLVFMCTGCHPWEPHPGGKYMFGFGDSKKQDKRVEHLVVPPPEIRQQMRRMEKKNGIILPLDPLTGKVFCGTCHNPHERGVIMGTAAARGADSKQRLRMQSICSNCHDK